MLGQILAVHESAMAALAAAYRDVHGGERGRAAAPSPQSPYTLRAGVAIVQIHGLMVKPASPLDEALLWLLGGTDTGRAREAVLAAGRDEAARAVLLQVSSPGGFVSGVGELADAVYALRGRKPVLSHIEDMGASAAYYVASQADHVMSSRHAQVGSIGVYSTLRDESGAASAAGVKVHVIRSAEAKGRGVPGAPVRDVDLSEAQRVVDGIAKQFVEAVARGRGVSFDRAKAWADGRAQFAEDARGLGLVDSIGTLDEAATRAAAGAQQARAAYAQQLEQARAKAGPAKRSSRDVWAEIEQTALRTMPGRSIKEFLDGPGIALAHEYRAREIEEQARR